MMSYLGEKSTSHHLATISEEQSGPLETIHQEQRKLAAALYNNLSTVRANFYDHYGLEVTEAPSRQTIIGKDPADTGQEDIHAIDFVNTRLDEAVEAGLETDRHGSDENKIKYYVTLLKQTAQSMPARIPILFKGYKPCSEITNLLNCPVREVEQYFMQVEPVIIYARKLAEDELPNKWGELVRVWKDR